MVAAANVLAGVVVDKSLLGNLVGGRAVQEVASGNVSATYVAEVGIHMHEAVEVDEKIRIVGEQFPKEVEVPILGVPGDIAEIGLDTEDADDTQPVNPAKMAHQNYSAEMNFSYKRATREKLLT